MKRSSQVRLLLLGGLAAGATPACAPADSPAQLRVSATSYYTNDFFVEGAGYYHAPFRAFYPHRYNHYDATKRAYFFGGQWGATPHASIVNVSCPTSEAATAAETAHAAISRGGFGSTGRSHHIWS